MVYFPVVRPVTKKIGKYYCAHQETLLQLAKKVNEFVINKDPYLKASLNYRAQEYERVQNSPTKFGTPYPWDFIEGMKPPYIMNKATGEYKMSDREEGFVIEDIADTCNYDFTKTFEHTFKIPTICTFNEGIGVYDDGGMLECAEQWKKKIDAKIPEFKEFKVEIQYER